MQLPKSLTTVTTFSKLMALFLFITLPFIGFILGIQYQYLLNQTKDVTEPVISVTPTKPEDTITGYIRSSGLQEEEKNNLGLEQVAYQLEMTCTHQNDICGFFLIPERYISLAQFKGKCVSVIGDLLPGWETVQSNDFQKDGQYTYERLAMTIRAIESQDASHCPWVPPSNSSTGDDGAIFSGNLIEFERPAPDIAYDYQFELDTPYIDNNNASGMPQTLRRIIVIPSNEDIVRKMEKFMKRDITIRGEWRWGYAESKVFSITNIQ